MSIVLSNILAFTDYQIVEFTCTLNGFPSGNPSTFIIAESLILNDQNIFQNPRNYLFKMTCFGDQVGTAGDDYGVRAESDNNGTSSYWQVPFFYKSLSTSYNQPSFARYAYSHCAIFNELFFRNPNGTNNPLVKMHVTENKIVNKPFPFILVPENFEIRATARAASYAGLGQTFCRYKLWLYFSYKEDGYFLEHV